MLKVGLRVKPNPNHERYSEWNYQHKDGDGNDCIGTITIIQENYQWVKVEWDNNENNHYTKDYLIPIDQDFDPKINITRW